MDIIASVTPLMRPRKADGIKPVTSTCSDCEAQIIDSTERIFCDPCIAADDRTAAFG